MKQKKIAIVVYDDKCIKCKKVESVYGFCSRTSSPYCEQCHNTRNIFIKLKDSFMGVPISNL